MKFDNIKKLAFLAIAGLVFTSCEKFLDKPSEDSYTTDNYYKTEAQCLGATTYLYNSPWYDFQRGFIKIGEVLSGNYFWGSSPYLQFTVNGTDEDLVNMSASLWAAVGHSNTVYELLKGSPVDMSLKASAMGECLLWKAMGYFFLVRTFGEVPIVHSNNQVLQSGAYSTMEKVKRADVYEYIIMTLEKAIELLPEKASQPGRLDKWSAKGLLAKVYLTKAGLSGTINKDDLAKAASYAKDVIQNSGKKLEANYEDIFLLKNRYTEEGLIAWRWTADGTNWTRQNSYQSDLCISGIDDWGATWGGWNGFSVDLQEAFGVKLLEQSPDVWKGLQEYPRLHATMMLPGFSYKQFWQDKPHDANGWSYIKFIYENSTTGSLESATGSNSVKHIYGDTYDHEQGAGCSDGRMASSVPTFLLRLSDVYLIYAEAMCGGRGSSTSDASAIDAFYAVRSRGQQNPDAKPSVITWDDIWKERRLEFAMEGDRWYDYVRTSYYDPDFCINELQSQKRNQFWGLDALYKEYYDTGTWNVDPSSMMYNTSVQAPNVTALMKKDPDSGKMYFILPPTADDVLSNPNLASDVDGVHVDVRATYSYE